MALIIVKVMIKLMNMRKYITLLFLAVMLSLCSSVTAQISHTEMRQRMQKSFLVKGGVGIEQILLALLQGTNEYFRENPIASLDDLDGTVNLDKKNGYVRMFNEGGGSEKMVCCYWNRNDGTILVAFYWDVHEMLPSEDYDCRAILQFYTYNSKTMCLDPIPYPFDAKLTGRFGHLLVELPCYGKDIEYRYGFEEEMGDFKCLKWNGYDFRPKKMKKAPKKYKSKKTNRQ